MNRTWRAFLTAAVLGLATPAWAGELTFWTWRQEDRAAYTELFAAFTKAHPGITVRFEAFPNEQYPTILSTALAGGKGADVLHTRAYGGLEQLARAGYVRPLNNAVPELAGFPAAALVSTSLRADKRVYSVPFASQTLALSAGAGPGAGTLLLVGFDPTHTTRVASGENAGRTLTEVNVVRSLTPVGTWHGEAISLRARRPAGERTAVLLQAENGRVMGAAVLPSG